MVVALSGFLVLLISGIPIVLALRSILLVRLNNCDRRLGLARLLFCRLNVNIRIGHYRVDRVGSIALWGVDLFGLDVYFVSHCSTLPLPVTDRIRQATATLSSCPPRGGEHTQE